MGRSSTRVRQGSGFRLIAGAAASLLVFTIAFGGCIARPKGEFVRPTDDDSGPPAPVLFEGGTQNDAGFEIPETDPHAVLGVDPPHGPFIGGQTVIVRGNGFSSAVRVWFGATEVSTVDVLPIDPSRVQVLVPPGPSGPAEVATQNGDDSSTRGALSGGYTYDAFYSEPSSGPTSGGTVLTLRGDATNWDAGTTVLVDLEPCEVLDVHSPTELDCRTSPGTQGSKPIRVTTADGVSSDVLDAFTYGDSDNGFRGGLSGDPLGSELRVLVLDGFSGAPVPDAAVIVDDSGSTQTATTDGKGLVVLQVDGPTATVTAAKKCLQPTTFFDVPVDTVTFFLDPVLSPACGTNLGDIPPVGGSRGLQSTVAGQLVWEGGVEFQRGGWSNVPVPSSEDERQVAYVFPLSTDPTRLFRLPSENSGITVDASGSIGYEFKIASSPGNVTMYALAGIENREVTPPTFIAYAMGILKGVNAQPGKQTADIFIKMDNPLDHALTMAVTGPSPTPRGPDRLRASVAIRVGNSGYAVLPVGQRVELLPVDDALPFVGLPPLVGSLAGAEYVSTASAATGQSETSPKSVLGLLASTTSNQLVTLDSFVEIPVVASPLNNGAWDGQTLDVGWAAGGAEVSLTVIEIESGGGLLSWTIAAPTDPTAPNGRVLRLPDLSAIPEAGLIPGSVSLSVATAFIREFEYGALRYGALGTRGWDAYAQDVSFAHF